MTDLHEDADRRPSAEATCIATLSLLEALILVLMDEGVLTADQVDDAFAAAIRAHEDDPEKAANSNQTEALRLLERLRTEGNSVRL